MEDQPSSTQDFVSGGKQDRMLKNKLRDIVDTAEDPFQANKDRLALVLAHTTHSHRNLHGGQTNFPTSRLSFLNHRNVERPYQITSPAPEVESELSSSSKSINTFLTEYPETISSDSEIEEVPYDTLPRTGVPLVKSDVSVSGVESEKKRVSAQASEWSSGDSDDESDEEYNPSAGETTTVPRKESIARDPYTGRFRPKYLVQNQKQTLSVRREADRARRAKKHELDEEQPQERPNQVVKLSFSPEGQASSGTSRSVVKNDIVTPEFPKGKRVVKKHGYSQTRKPEPASTQPRVSTDYTTATAIDHRARIAYQKELEQELRESLDQDIVQQVEAEGWITPAGRLFKTGIRQMQRVMREREAVEAANHRRVELSSVEQQWKIQRLESENEKLREVVEEMRHVLGKLDLGKC